MVDFASSHIIVLLSLLAGASGSNPLFTQSTRHTHISRLLHELWIREFHLNTTRLNSPDAWPPVQDTTLIADWKEAGGQVPAPFLLSMDPRLGSSLPSTIDDVKRLQRQLAERVAEQPVQFILAFSLLYVCLQTFTLPGATVLNILAGSLFGFLPGLLLITLLVTLGTLGSYTLSSLVLCEALQRWMPQRLERLRSEVAAQRHRLLSYLLFLRFNPVMPSWFINIASPVAGVPWQTFVLASILGFLPHTALAVNAGCVLSSIDSLNDLYSTKVMVLLFLFSVVALIPTFVKSGGNNNGSKSPRATPDFV